MDAIVGEIKLCRYCSIILDYTPDISHTEKLSVVIRTVSVEDKPQVKEHFMGLLEAEATIGEELSYSHLEEARRPEHSF